MRKIVLFLFVTLFSLTGFKAGAQELDLYNLENLDLRQLLGKVLTVKKGFSPDFFIGKQKIPSVQTLGKILGAKNNTEINRLFRTFKTGRTVYKVASYSGTAIAVYGAVRGLVNNTRDSVTESNKDAALAAVYSGLGSVATGVLVKLLTKGASYKAVDLFGGAVKKKLKDIFKVDIGMTQYHGAPGMRAGIKIAL